MCEAPGTHTLATAGVAETIVPENIYRHGFHIRNLDTSAVVNIAFDNVAEAGKGITLRPGESFDMCALEHSVAYISAISDKNNTHLVYQQFACHVV